VGLEIRLGEVEDTPAVIKLGMRFARETKLGKWSNATPEKLESTLVPLIMQFGVLFVALRDDVLIGALAMVVQPSYMSNDTFAEEVAWWVNPEERGTAGLRLVDAALVWCSQHKVDVVKMSTPYGTEVGRVLERRGFEAVEIAFLKRLDVAVQQQGRDDSNDRRPDGSGRDDHATDHDPEPGPPASS